MLGQAFSVDFQTNQLPEGKQTSLNAMEIDEEIMSLEPVRRMVDIYAHHFPPPKRYYGAVWRGLVNRAVLFYKAR